MNRYLIKVFDDFGDAFRTYSVPARDSEDARLIAFILDQGFEEFKYGTSCTIEDGEYELAKLYTEVIKEIYE